MSNRVYINMRDDNSAYISYSKAFSLVVKYCYSDSEVAETGTGRLSVEGSFIHSVDSLRIGKSTLLLMPVFISEAPITQNGQTHSTIPRLYIKIKGELHSNLSNLTFINKL